MKRHRGLIETRATIMEFQEMRALRENSELLHKSAVEAENDRRRDLVKQWLLGFCNENELERNLRVRVVASGSGRWLLEKSIFRGWFSPNLCSAPLLWLTGIPGAGKILRQGPCLLSEWYMREGLTLPKGKTVLASVVIDELIKLAETTKMTVAYFYCKYGDERRNSFLAVARSLLSQLQIKASGDLISYMYEKATTSSGVHLTSTSTAKEILKLLIGDCRTIGPVYLVIDGIDECGREDRKEIANWFQSVSDSLPVDEKDRFRCLFVSQDDGIGRKDFKEVPTIKITPDDNRKDIEFFAAVWHKTLEAKFGELRSSNEQITNIVTARAGGM